MPISSAVSSPTHAQIDPTSVCDLKCTYCVGRDWKPGHLSEATFEEILQQLPDLIYVQLQGEGEPMLGRVFWAGLARLRERAIDVGFTTNGRHLSKSSVERLVDLGVRSIAVSVDSCDPHRYRELRGGDLSRTLAGLRVLAAARPPDMDVFVTSVLTRQTFDDFADVKALSAELSLSPPSCQALQVVPAYTSHYRGLTVDANGLASEQLAEMREYQKWRAAFRATRGLCTYFESVMKSASGARCPFIDQSIHIRYDGETFPCCFVKEDEYSFGNMVELRLDGPAVIGARETMFRDLEAGGTPSPCRGCHVLAH